MKKSLPISTKSSQPTAEEIEKMVAAFYKKARPSITRYSKEVIKIMSEEFRSNKTVATEGGGSKPTPAWVLFWTRCKEMIEVDLDFSFCIERMKCEQGNIKYDAVQRHPYGKEVRS